MSSRPVILLAHGSRHGEVSVCLDAVAAALSERVGRQVVVAYLDLTSPLLNEVCCSLAQVGAGTEPARRTELAHNAPANNTEPSHASEPTPTDADIIPLLFTDAFHSRVDVPEQVRLAEEASGLTLHIRPSIDTGDDLAEILNNRFSALAKRLRSRCSSPLADDPARILYAVGSSHEPANVAVRALAAQCDATSVNATVGNPRGVEAVRGACGDRPAIIQPLFVAPGTLWDKAKEKLTADSMICGEPLGCDLVGILSARLDSQIAE